jgi:threonine aldolase
MHLDGARLFNAVVKTQRSAKDVCSYFDSVSVCLSKGLGTPAGSVLCGTKALIKRAQRHRKMLGGGMRQVGILAAACDYALDHHVQRLEDDHKNASQLAAALAQIRPLTVQMPQTNILFVDVPSTDVAALKAHLHQNSIVAIVGPRTRIVTHLDISAADVERVVDVFAAFYRGRQRS